MVQRYEGSDIAYLRDMLKVFENEKLALLVSKAAVESKGKSRGFDSWMSCSTIPQLIYRPIFLPSQV
jgi:hypothetical protein